MTGALVSFHIRVIESPVQVETLKMGAEGGPVEIINGSSQTFLPIGMH